MQDEIRALYECVRQLLILSENVEHDIQRVKLKKLRQKYDELIKTIQADIMIFLDLVFQIESCETTSDINEIIESFSESNEVVNR